MTPLTDRQAEVLGLIREHIRAHGYAPTLRWLMGKLGIKSTNAMNDHLIAIERKGWIRRGGIGEFRAITLINETACPHCGQPMPGAEPSKRSA